MATSGPDDRRGGGIGILGGTFDPVHKGHLQIALDARRLLDLDEVRLVPLAHAVHREQPETPAALRLEMLEATVREHPSLRVDDRELRREGPSYTVDTLRSLHADLPDRSLCLLLGEDAFAGFHTWRRPDEILTLANIAILQRPGHQLSAGTAAQRWLHRHRVDRLDPVRTGQIVTCPVTQLDIASSDIRTRVAAGRDIDDQVTPAVAGLIARYALYR